MNYAAQPDKVEWVRVLVVGDSGMRARRYGKNIMQIVY